METPSSIGRYRIKRWLASGAMGNIYEAHDPLIERPIALKVLRRELLERGDRDGWLQRFRHEARAAGPLLHPNIVTLLDYGEQDGVPFLAMEYVEGESLDQLIKRSGRLAYADAVWIITQVLNALDFAHANAVVHRDIKPSNVLLTKGSLAKVADFGIAHIETSDLTSEGDILGTPSYMAPEQLLGKTVDHRADQFAAGALFFELLTGAKPFGGKSLGESMLNMERRGPADICDLNPEVTPELKRVIERSLAYEPEDRHADVAAFHRAIIESARASEPRADRPLRTDETVVAPLVSPPLSLPPTDVPVAPAPFAVELLAEVERDLATFIGPIAKSAVRRAARSTVDLSALYQVLADYIESKGDRESFISTGQRRIAVSHRYRPSSGSQGSLGSQPSLGQSGADRPTAIISIAPAALSRLETELTVYIGPIASIVLRRLLSKSSSLPDFYRDLAAYIPDERERSKFLGSRLGPSN
jgi:eukaryotic-like serine/threonine-protein kinase